VTGEKRLKGVELLDEVEWLLDGGVHPELVLQELGTTAARVESTARRHGRPHLSAVYMRVRAQERRDQGVAA